MSLISEENQEINRSFEEAATKELALKHGLDYVNLAYCNMSADLPSFLSLEQLSQWQILPIKQNGSELEIAVVDPQKTNQTEVEKLCLKKPITKIKWVLCSESAWQEKYKEIKEGNTKCNNTANNDESGRELSQSELFTQLSQALPTLKTEAALQQILETSLQLGASDLHLQPTKTHTLLRLRIDGILYDGCQISLKVATALINRIKYIGNMHPNVHEIPQDGRMFFEVKNRRVDVRVSVLPTEFLESIVMRFLEASRSVTKIEKLGFATEQQNYILQSLAQPNGLVLVTGPTGSGKTTTLYSLLDHLNDSERKIVTLEDPIEYHLHNITQSQVDENKDFNFESGFKALLRHDPDVILVGEIRSRQTCKLAVDAAQTGHLVLSSLHANNAAAVLARLHSFDIESYQTVSSLRLIISQRLVRRLCPKCKKPAQNHEKSQKFGVGSAFEPVGCKACSHTGYKGRVVISECLLVNQVIREAFLRRASEDEIRDIASAEGFKTLIQDGQDKVSQGLTSIAEIERVA